MPPPTKTSDTDLNNGGENLQGVSKTLLEIPVAEISPNPHNPRLIFNQEELDELKGSLQKVGILVPLTVYRNSRSYPPTKFVLLDGERRWRCAKELNWKTVKANVIDEPEDVTQNILFMFNIHHYRREWELFPTALKLEQLIKAMGTDQESVISNFTGVSRSMVRRCKTLLWFPHKYRDTLMERGGRISTDFFIEVYPIVRRLSFEDEFSYPAGVEKLTDALIAKFSEGGTITDVKDFRHLRRSMGFADKRGTFAEFKSRLNTFLHEPRVDFTIFTIGLEDERSINSLLRHVSAIIETLRESKDDFVADDYVVDQLRKLADALNQVLEEGE